MSIPFKIKFIFIIYFLASFHSFAQRTEIPKTEKKSKLHATDIAKEVPAPYNYLDNKKYKGLSKSSQYIEMRDGIKIAVDIYLPKNLKKGEQLPALIHQTRYWRSPKIKFPFNLLTNGLIGSMGDMINAFIENGYAIINVDVRGSGASLGSRLHPWTIDEIQDGYEIIEWAIQQEWCNGKIGSLGASYSGTTAEFLTTTQHPNLKAVALLFSLFDVYEDNAFPGGVHNSWFTKSWGEANERMDDNELPSNYKKYKWLIGGVSKVKKNKPILKQAIEDHQKNRNVHDGALTIDYRDDTPKGGYIKTLDIFSPHHYIQKLNEANIPIYSYSGWMDGAYQNAAIKRYLNLNTSHKKLIIGPWEHGGKYNISPYHPSYAGFDHVGELIKFFDFHLKGKKNGLAQEAPIHYYTLAEEKWKSSDVWPPSNTQYDTLFFSANHQLITKQKNISNQNYNIKIDNSTGTGDMSRWKAVNGKITTAYMYHDWNEKSKNMLSFYSDVLKNDLEITGHALFDIFISSNKNDASIFVYLEDIDKNGTAHYITEGILRASHRAIQEDIIYKEIGPSISHKREDSLPTNKEEKIRLISDMIPTSYMIKKGHQIRISIAGCDKDHFEILYPEGYELNLHCDKKDISKIILPVIK